jgi:hypothetical protein
MYYDRNGQPITSSKWVATLEENRRVARTNVTENVYVSTIWLWLDHGQGPTGKPLIFESMVFMDGSGAEHDMDRYETEEEALAGHEAMVERWKKKLNVTAKRGQPPMENDEKPSNVTPLFPESLPEKDAAASPDYEEDMRQDAREIAAHLREQIEPQFPGAKQADDHESGEKFSLFLTGPGYELAVWADPTDNTLCFSILRRGAAEPHICVDLSSNQISLLRNHLAELGKRAYAHAHPACKACGVRKP